MNTPLRWMLTLCAACGLLLVATLGYGQGAAPVIEDLAAFPQTTLTITHGSTRHDFTVWEANTPAREEQGLMFVRDLPADKGMVFGSAPPRVWSMWMKNCYITMDMLFVAPDGHVVKIAHALPHDESIISSDVPVGGVIELQGGLTDKLGLKVGDIAKWKAAAPGTAH